MSNQYEVSVAVPASTANLGPGFDTIGMAFQLYTKIKMRKAEKTFFHLIGEDQQGIPTDKRNLIYEAADFLCQKANIATPELEVEVESEIPLTRGLGSSASAIVGGMVAVNAVIGEPFTKDDIFQFAAEMEGHPDNVGASVFGGIVVAAKNNQDKYTYLTITPPQELNAVVCIPDYELSTKMAREVLPTNYSKQDTIHAISHAALLVGAMAKGDLSVLWDAMDDRVHQPYRKTLMPGFEEILENSKNHGANGVALSGAGPTIIAFTTGDSEKLISYINSVMDKNGITAKTVKLPIDVQGATVTKIEQEAR